MSANAPGQSDVKANEEMRTSKNGSDEDDWETEEEEEEEEEEEILDAVTRGEVTKAMDYLFGSGTLLQAIDLYSGSESNNSQSLKEIYVQNPTRKTEHQTPLQILSEKGWQEVEDIFKTGDLSAEDEMGDSADTEEDDSYDILHDPHSRAMKEVIQNAFELDEEEEEDAVRQLLR